jgi:hypothetical protein
VAFDGAPANDFQTIEQAIAALVKDRAQAQP